MKSLLVTAVVLSSFAAHSYAEQPEEKGKRDAQPAARSREQMPPAAAKRPDIKMQPRGENPKPQTAPPKADHSVIPPIPPANSTAAPAAKPAPSAPPAKPAPQAPVAPTAGKATPKPTGQVNPPPGRVLQGPAKNQVPPRSVVNTRPLPPRVIPPGGMRPQVVVQRFPHVRPFVEARTLAYRKAYNDRLLFLQRRYAAPVFYAPLRVAYRPWVRVGFYAYAYPVRPVVEFYTYFSNPCVAWFYNDYDADFYQPFYSQYVTRYPELGRGYAHVGIYFPTQEFLDLNVSISEMPIESQVHYRRSMGFLAARLSERYRAPISRHQVIVNHYQMLPNRRAVVIEGFVDNEQVQMPFKALVDLNNADRSMLFAVNSWNGEQQPNAEQSEDLFDLNDEIQEYGGQIEQPPTT